MKVISLNNTLPNVFKDEPALSSDIWQAKLSFEKGSTYLIEARSGTGKSSLCSYIYGYRADYLGNILFDESDIRGFNSVQWNRIRCTELSLLFQELNLFPELTAWENVKLKNNLTLYKTDEEIMSMFEALDIPQKKNIKIAKMSWGQQQRVAVIRCLCQPFSFIILDEPISHLDDENAVAMSELIRKEAMLQGAGIIATSIGKHLPLDYTKKLSL